MCPPLPREFVFVGRQLGKALEATALEAEARWRAWRLERMDAAALRHSLAMSRLRWRAQSLTLAQEHERRRLAADGGVR